MRIKFISFLIVIVSSCSVEKRLNKSAATIFNTVAFNAAHFGISVFEPATSKRWYDYQGDKYFIPASNTKIPTCYAAMKYLGDSIPGLRYNNSDSALYIQGTGDPTLLHPLFQSQPVFNFLSRQSLPIIFTYLNWDAERLGSGWSWNDYNEAYMAERSALPVFGNVRTFTLKDTSGRKGYLFAVPDWELSIIPAYEERIRQVPYYLPRQYLDSGIQMTMLKNGKTVHYDIYREQGSNKLYHKEAISKTIIQKLPFFTENPQYILDILSAEIKKKIVISYYPPDRAFEPHFFSGTVYSQKTDSVLKVMMHQSDNFFAEQILLMVGNEYIRAMNDSKIIDTLLKSDLLYLPQKPRWADGSGLSRYNLFTPRDMVFILDKMKKEFGMKRIGEIFPTGNEGTLTNYYVSDSGYIHAKTGTLSGVVALSGFLTTKKNRELIFSVLVNNHQSSATEIRRTVEKFIKNIRENY